ncbi:uncharacterized protein LOC133031275 [Cannabis sativa]|uniref:uncharacterized protein LOC133031275 n=1 Tax=Cannabis sativa TaxID=3483 RepID=UPI0029CA748F|nr:uncharacterized protein LOC133031275 [Cannabis sativa]
MNIISWNCRGLGNPRALQFLVDICVSKKPKFLFLCETLCKKDIVERVKIKLGFESCFSVEAQGRKGGLALFWKISSEAHLLGYSNNHIDMEISITGYAKWRLTGFYGEPQRSLRATTWNLLRDIAAESTLPWCVIGDFNNITSNGDVKGGRPYPDTLINGFNLALCDCRLDELALGGYQYTWERGRGGPAHVEIRLDRAFATHEWFSIFLEAKLSNFDYTSSDHTPLLLEPDPTINFRPVRLFRYENAWGREALCGQLVKNCWDENIHVSLAEKIHMCSLILTEWGYEITGSFKQRLNKSKKKMSHLKSATGPFSTDDFSAEQCNYFEILAQQEIYWKQRSKQFWLHAGDKNSKYFHATASARKRSNEIVQLQDSAGNWKNWSSGLDHVIVDYFSSLYNAEGITCDTVVRGINCSVSNVHNEALLQPVTPEEIKQALFQMHPDKAPGLVGMGPGFFQQHWETVGPDIVHLVTNFFVTEELPPSINDTHLVLIPKKKNFTTMGDLRPIALCNVSYKIVAKVLANRMRGMIDLIISPTQSAFIPGRLISDNIMVAFEVMHYLKRKRRGKKGFMALKLDMSKAYDRVEWDYLKAVMVKMGFASKWINLIMKCVTSVRYSVVHNGHILGPIIPSRGIRQGDPLSTYLFIICAEGFSALIKSYEANRIIQGCRVANGAPSITHMLFADDSYLFCQATSDAAGSMNRLLHTFELASGQRVNVTKSSIFFSPNTVTSVKEQITSILGMAEATAGSFYLGLPNIIGRKKTVILGFLKNKIVNRINSWDGKFLSRAGKEILLKTVIQSLPTYAMSVFLIPLGICQDIEKIMASFWWKTKSSNGQGIIWMSWDRMAAPKDSGGMGFRHLHDFNLAMLAKQGWRLLYSPSSLASQVYKAKYYPRTDFLHAELGNNPSFVWRSIWSAQHLVRLGARINIGTGLSTHILKQPWLPDSVNPYVSTTGPGLDGYMVSSLFDVSTRSWDVSLVQDMFNTRDAALILGIPLSSTATEDCWSWTGDRTGSYTVKSAYAMLQLQKTSRSGENNSGFWHKLWHLKIPPKVTNFMWRVVSDALPTCLQLVTKCVSISPTCPVCQLHAETPSHVLLNCPLALSCWHKVDLIPLADSQGTIGHWLYSVFANYDDDVICRVVMICWALWKARNTLVWDKKASSATQILTSAWVTLDHWRKAQDKTCLLSSSLLHDGSNIEQWIPPASNTIKINVDGAIFEKENAYGFGVVARDSTGQIIDFIAKYYHGDYKAEVVEALGVKEALSWIKNKGWNTIEVETDSLLTVQAIFSTQQMSSVFGLVTNDCKTLLSSSPNTSLRFVKRSANRVVHFVARRSRFYSDRSILENNVLADLQAIL